MNKRYAHACPDWDYMRIDEDSAELVGCSCFSEPEFLRIREQHAMELDRINEQGDSLVARLRRLAEAHAEPGLYKKEEWIEWEAADEIERLTVAIKKIADGFLPDGTYSGAPIYELVADYGPIRSQKAAEVSQPGNVPAESDLPCLDEVLVNHSGSELPGLPSRQPDLGILNDPYCRECHSVLSIGHALDCPTRKMTAAQNSGDAK
jgi:hypothetical protein